ncbi:MAG: GNAT family N-acetyltransferase [Aquabacterium sp.]|uniref:GNAT family N-acetyltransferase n=1 Tax=Aquabacterium sp. TaxID=1872578 RepID=UPI0012219027|nr:GNAT family N-acetyltransferase [Aquabacterium sp.]TAK83319.1 MAG: GNAT family N-acetyltransferase [Aquabacterium sp.]
MPFVRTRAATPDDLALTYAITEDAMRGYVEQTWGKWDEEEQLQKHRANFTPETCRIILVEGEVAGLFVVENFPSHVWLVKLYLLAAYRGQGIGSTVLQTVQEDARVQGKPVTLRVLRVNNRAQALYARHGFKVTEETAERLHMASGA